MKGVNLTSENFYYERKKCAKVIRRRILLSFGYLPFVEYIAELCYTVANESIHSITEIDSQKSLLVLQGRPEGINSWFVCSMVSSRV